MHTFFSPSADKVTSFTQLHVWQEGHRLVMLIYKMTKKFPKEELFGLTSQIRRASVSITSNIAEGFGRPSKTEKVHFYNMSISSLYEVQNQSLIAHDAGYLFKEDLTAIAEQSVKVGKMINASIRALRASKGSSS